LSLVKVQEKAVVVVKSLAIATLAVAVLMFAGCATTHSRTATAADGLERSADRFAAGICNGPKSACSTDQYLPAARTFADEAHRFRETLDSAGEREVVSEFEQLWTSYHKLRDEVYSLDDAQLRAELKPITSSFVDVQIHVKTGYSQADPALWVSGGYVLDPIYN
jgi:hypothetical protein